MATTTERDLARIGQTRGRPRDATRDDALRKATLEEMARVGYRALTMDAVAARAKAGKATIYRRWESKLDLVIDTCQHLANEVVPDRDTGSVAEDLREFLRAYATMLSGSVGRAAQALVGELPHEPELAAAFRRTFLVSQRETLRGIVYRGIDRGEVSPTVATDLITMLAGASLIYRLMLSGEPLTWEFVDQMIDSVLLPLLR